MSPLELSTAAKIRLQRRMPKAIYKEDIQQLIAPFPRDADQAVFLVELLRATVPPEAVAASKANGGGN